MWMPKTLVVVLTLVVSINSFSADEHDSSKAGAGVGTENTGFCGTPGCEKKRPVGSSSLKEKELSFLTTLFPNLGRTYLESTYKDTIPAALEKATGKEKDETDTSKIMAALFGTIKEDQRDAIAKKVEEERSNELTKTTDDKRDTKYVDLLNRLSWAGKSLQGSLVKEPDAQPFLKKFVGEKLDFKSGDFKEIQDQNQGILDAMKKALAGGVTGTEAKKFLRDNLNRDALLPFVDHQLKSGNKAFATNLLDAVSWSQGPGGPKFIDMVGPGGEPQRLFVGNDSAAMANTIKAFSTDKGGFFKNALAPTEFSSVAKEWYADNTGKLVKGVPAGATTAITAPLAGTTGGATSTPGTGATGGTGSTATTSAPFSVAEAKAIIDSKNCNQCHAGTKGEGLGTKDFVVKRGAKSYTLTDVVAAIDSDKGGMRSKVPADVQAKLRSWAASI